MVSELRRQLPVDDGPIGLFGGSLGGMAALLALAETDVPVGAAAVVNAAIRLSSVLDAYRISHQLDSGTGAIADQLDLVHCADEIAGREPQPALLLVNGENDQPGFPADATALHKALAVRYRQPGQVAAVRVPGLAHALAAPPGLEPAPQTPHAAQVDQLFTDWYTRHLIAKSAA